MMNPEQLSENDQELSKGKAEELIRKQKQKLCDLMEHTLERYKESSKSWKRLDEIKTRMTDLLDELKEKYQELDGQVDQTEDLEERQELLVKALKLEEKARKIRNHLLNDMQEAIEAEEQVQEELENQADALKERMDAISSILESDPQSN